MELKDEIHINASRETVFAALNNPAILQQAIPGCETLEKVSDTELTATVVLKIGPIKAKFKGAVELSDLNPPQSYTISGDGKGGPAGQAKGGAEVQLTDNGDGTTTLAYKAKAEVGGKLAQLGSRLVSSTAKKLAGDFFKSFAAILEAPPVPAAEPVAVPAAAQHPANPVAFVTSSSSNAPNVSAGHESRTGHEEEENPYGFLWIVGGIVFVIGAVVLFV
jgi:carbon monoxide dehydrogenase subunit G